MNPTADVVVIGAGAMGCSIAFHLARAGAGRVTVLDKGGICSGMTYRSGALVRLHYTNPHEARVALKAYEYFHRWSDIVGGDCGFQNTGFLFVVAPDQVDRLHKNVAALRALGVDTEVVSPEEVKEAQPFARVDDIGAAAYEPGSGYADPHKTTMAFADAAKRHGATFVTGCAVTGIRVSNGRVLGVDTEQGRIDAGAVVCAAGPWAPRVLATAGVTFNIAPTLAEVVHFRRPPETAMGHMVYIDHAAGTYFRPAYNRMTFVGAGHGDLSGETDESGGRPRLARAGEGHGGSILGDPDHLLDSNSLAQQEFARGRIAVRIPAYRTAEYTLGHQGVYDMSEDGKAILDRAPGVEGLFIAGGFSGTGFKKSPAVGLIMSELVMGQTPSVPIHAFRFSRFAENDPIRGEHEYGWVESAQLSI
jgi:sarcosine oxidase subunit beta